MRILILAGIIFASLSVSGSNVPELMYYKFDETGTSVLNQAGSPVGNSSAVISGVHSQGGSGQFGGALIGTGGNTSVNYMDTGWNLNLGTGSWTISFWCADFNTGSDLSYIFGESTTSFRCFTGGVAGVNNWILRGDGINDVLLTGAATITPHVVHFVYDAAAGNIKAYMDGVLHNTVAQAPLNLNGANSFIVGGYSAANAMNGKIDEFRMYNRALDATEIAATWNQDLAPMAVPLSAWAIIPAIFLIGVIAFIRFRRKVLRPVI